MSTWPSVGSTRRLTILRLVVLPHPLGPTRTQISPGGTVSDRSLTAAGPPRPRPKRLVTRRKSTVAPRFVDPFNSSQSTLILSRSNDHTRRPAPQWPASSHAGPAD